MPDHSELMSGKFSPRHHFMCVGWVGNVDIQEKRHLQEGAGWIHSARYVGVLKPKKETGREVEKNSRSGLLINQ